MAAARAPPAQKPSWEAASASSPITNTWRPAMARELYDGVPARSPRLVRADLEAACPNRLDFAQLLRKVEKNLA